MRTVSKPFNVSQTKPVSVTLDTYVKRTARLASVERNTVLEAIKSQHKTNFTFRFRSREQR